MKKATEEDYILFILKVVRKARSSSTYPEIIYSGDGSIRKIRTDLRKKHLSLLAAFRKLHPEFEISSSVYEKVVTRIPICTGNSPHVRTGRWNESH